MVPALPDSARQTTYTITASTCACSVGFQLYGDSTDFQNWIEVWVNGVQYQYNDPTYGWSLSSATGPFSTIPRPITDAVLTFNNPQTGTVIIVGAQRPRRTAEFQEGQGVTARSLNQWFNTVVAMLREEWDKLRDLSGRGLFFAPGNTVGPMPQPSACASAFLTFDASGLNPKCVTGTPAPNPTLLVNTQGGNYTIATTDCGGNVVATGANAIITLPAASGFPANCVIRLADGNTARGQQLSGFPATLATPRLFPTQSLIVATVSGAWFVLQPPKRWKVISATNLYASTTGNNSNDCLDATAPCLTIGAALAIDQDFMDHTGNSQTSITTVNLATGTYNECIAWFGTLVASEDIIVLGSLSAPGSYKINCTGAPVVQTRDMSTISFNGVWLNAATAGQSDVDASQFSTVDLNTVDLGVTGSSTMLNASELGTINQTGTGQLLTTSSANILASAVQSAFINLQNITNQAGATITTFALASDHGEVNFVSGRTVTNSGTVTNMCSISLLGIVNRNSVTLPGTACSPTSGGQLN